MAGIGARLSSNRNSLVGLDIQADQLVAAEVSQANGHELLRAAVQPLEQGLVREGELADPERLGDAVKAMFRENSLGRRVRLGIANQRVVVRSMELPAIADREELDAAVRFQAGERLPMPIEDAVLDYQIVERFTDAGGAAKLRVVVVAAPREMIDRVLEVAHRAGLKLAGIDVSTFALIRAYNGSIDDSAVGEQDGAVVYCHLGSVTSLAVAHGPACMFTRTLPYGTESMAEELAAKRQMPVEDARSWLTYVGLGRELEAIEGDAEMIADTRAVLESGVGQLAGVIQASLDYYMSQDEARTLTHTIICGPGTAIDGLCEALREHVPDSIDPRRPQIEGEGAGAAMPAQLALAYGLAVDEVVV